MVPATLPTRHPFALRIAPLLAFVLLSVATQVTAQSASVSVPAEVAAGGEVLVTWSGPQGDGDFISIDPAGSPEARYGRYEYVRGESPLKLRAPGTAGDYEVRYHQGGSGYPVLATAPLRVVPVTAVLQAPASAEIGTEVEISWTGPAGPGDFVSIDEEGAADSRYGPYAYVSKGSPLTITAPAEPGRYLVRYHLGLGSYPVIGTTPLTLEAVEANLEAPDRADAGSTIEVRWNGPDNPRDFISIDEVGAADGSYGRYAYTAAGNPLELVVPDEPGTYVLRYHLGSGRYRVIGSKEITVGGVEASVTPVGTIVAGEPFEVSWTGPDHERDFVTIVPAGTPDRRYENYAYTRRGSPLRIEGPDAPGTYEIRYLTGQDYLTLASAEVEVQPGQATGRLRVLPVVDGGTGAGALGGVGAVEVILDASGSMLQRLGTTRRIELARDALLDLTAHVIPAGTPFALRVFGHRVADSCRTDLEIPLGPLDPGRAAAFLHNVEAKNLAKTPIAESLRAVGRDLAQADGPRLVVLVTDGEETCDGDPAEAIRELAQAGIDVRVNIVGFAIDELMVKEEFERWARLGGGRYLDAADGDALLGAVRGALAASFEVLRGDEVVATGTVGDDQVELPVGSYRVRLSDGTDLGTTKVVKDRITDVRAGE